VTAPSRKNLELAAAAAMELQRRRQSRKTVYGFFEPTDVYGGRLVRSWQDRGDGVYEQVDATPDVTLPLKLEPLLLTPKRFKVLYGGRSSAKSLSVGNIRAAHAKDYGFKTLCLRELQNSIEDSVHALLKQVISTHGWTDFEVTDKAVRMKGEDVFKFRGLARNVTAVQSMYGFRDSWVEEAQSLSAKSLTALTPTIREAGSELWFTLNPMSSADPISQRFLKPFEQPLISDGYYEDDLHLVIRINYTDNPWHRELEPERLYDQVNLSPAEYRHKWLGEYNDEVANALIPVEHFNAAIDAHIKLGWKPTGARVAAHDPSDTGPDDKGYALRYGSLIEDVRAMPDGDVHDGLDWATSLAIEARADWFVYDADGLGLALGRDVDKAFTGKQVRVREFHGGAGVEFPEQPYTAPGKADHDARPRLNKDAIFNLRAQYAQRLADRFRNTYRAVVKGEYIDPDEMISLSSDIEDLDGLRAEVCRVPTKPNGSGKIQLMTKQEMARPPLSLPSPNRFDALMMTQIIPDTADEPVVIKFTGWQR